MASLSLLAGYGNSSDEEVNDDNDDEEGNDGNHEEEGNDEDVNDGAIAAAARNSHFPSEKSSALRTA
ncbi:unnamed protein product [Lampetra fluviatilis]